MPEGRHAFEVKGVAEDEKRLEIRLDVGERRYGWVFCRLPHGQEWAGRIAASFARAVGVKAGGWGDAVASGELVGRRVEARIYHRATERGTFANVGEFHAIEEQAPKPARQSPAKRAAAEPSSDDIPF